MYKIVIQNENIKKFFSEKYMSILGIFLKNQINIKVGNYDICLSPETEMFDSFLSNIKNKYQNDDSYIEKIQEVDKKIQDIVDNKVRDRLIFADKMPMQYFIDYYDLKVSAAFNGCSTETEPSASTIAYLMNKAKEENIPVILYIELNPGRVANTIADEIGNGCKSMQIQTLHNVSLDDFNNGETWVSLMTRNIDVLKAALQ